MDVKNMAKPKISIIVPVYNVEKYLPICMDSLINQTFGDIEIIAVNDGSTDSSPEVLCRYAARDGRVRVIHKANEGVSIARNTAIQYSAGEYLMFVDGDDWIDADTCEKTVGIARQLDCDVVMWSYVREFGTHSAPKKIFQDNIVFAEKGSTGNLHRRFMGGIANELARPENLDALCTIWGKLYRSSLIKDNGILFEDIRRIGTYEDGLFNLYLFKYVNKAVFLNSFFYHYRKDRDGSITTQYKPRFTEQWHTLFELMGQYIELNQLDNVFRQALNNRIAVSILGLGLNELRSGKSAWQQITDLKAIIRDEKFRQAYKQLALKYFPLHWKAFYGCAKYDLVISVYFMLLVIQKIIHRQG